ncbi:MAG: TIGR03086 family metal-binding protein [Stackebrandtia sp.]
MKQRFDKAVAGILPVVNGIEDTQLTNPTPCGEYDVRALLNHLLWVVTEFRKVGQGGDLEVGRPPDAITGDWREAFDAEATALAGAWADPAATEGAPTSGLPRAVLSWFPVIDLTIHGWDLARATDQPFECAPARAEELYAVMERMSDIREANTAFAEQVPVPDDATASTSCSD